MVMNPIVQDLLVFATGSVVGVAVTIIVLVFVAKYLLGKILALLAKYGIFALGAILPKDWVKGVNKFIKAAESQDASDITKMLDPERRGELVNKLVLVIVAAAAIYFLFLK